MQYSVDADNIGEDSGEAFEQPPMLDAQTAYHLLAFLHWTQVTLQRVHGIDPDPYRCFDDVRDSADSAIHHMDLRGIKWFEVLP